MTGSYTIVDLNTGEAPSDKLFFNSENPHMDKTYAEGIRNSVGLTVDRLLEPYWILKNRPSFSDKYCCAGIQ
ncbi:MAG TPA: hypothetical protein VFT71_03210 [Candidatus Nitrosocosmicus sp.]|nr:hypothetical protein [Candidatus Nitrosocosmicus sp.]